MKTSVLSMVIVLSMVLIPVGSALEVPVTSYWGTATVDGSPVQGASITVYDATGNKIAANISLEHGLYTVKVQWDDLTTTDIDEGAVEGETITFKINGITATSSVIKAKGTNTQLDLAVTPSPSGGGGGGSGSGGTTASSVSLTSGWNLVALTGAPAVTSTPSVMSSVTDNITVVWGYNKSALQPWEIYDPVMPSELNSLNNMVPGRGYWIYAKVDTEWTA